jgi:hypothetical protein
MIAFLMIFLFGQLLIDTVSRSIYIILLSLLGCLFIILLLIELFENCIVSYKSYCDRQSQWNEYVATYSKTTLTNENIV